MDILDVNVVNKGCSAWLTLNLEHSCCSDKFFSSVSIDIISTLKAAWYIIEWSSLEVAQSVV